MEYIEDIERRNRRRAVGVVFAIVCCCYLVVGLIILFFCVIFGCSGDSSTTPAPPSPSSCCPDDPFVFAGSPYGSDSPTLCGGHDYNCDGVDESYACCYDEVPAENTHDARIVWHITDSCNNTEGALRTVDICGACTGSEVVYGWECSTPISKKRFIPACPDSCGGEIIDVTPQHPPSTGECALFIDHCVGAAGGDGERCCQSITQ